jgi:hypothetical protein
MSLAAKFSRLGECAGVSAGFPFRGAVDMLEAGDVAVIQMRNVEGESVDWPALSRVALPSKRKPAYLIEGDVIFTARGRRNFALALGEIPGPAVCSPHFFVLRIGNPSVLLPAFLAWQINQKPAQEYLQQAATGSHILNITRAAIENLPVGIPPREVQCEVLALVDAARRERDLINALIDNRQRQLDAVAAQILIPERLSA